MTESTTEPNETISNERSNVEENGRQHMTLFNLLQGYSIGRGAAVTRGGKPATGGLVPKALPRREGLRKLSPAELLSVRVPVARIRSGQIEGYQRKFSAKKARAVGRWLQDNRVEYLSTLPVIEISVLSDGMAFYTDGQHRAAGAVIANVPIRAVITRRTTEQARRLFTLQGLATRPSRSLLIIDSDGPFEEYIQDALTCDTHPWSGLISASQSGSSKYRMSPTAAFTMLQIFVRGRNSPAGRDVGQNIDPSQFDKEAADLLASLMNTFGAKATNPLAYGSTQLRAIAQAARAVFRSREATAEDYQRWLRRMPAFQFASFAYLKSSTELANQMIKYWNTGLSAARKAQRLD